MKYVATENADSLIFEFQPKPGKKKLEKSSILGSIELFVCFILYFLL